jgi:hypothetical protein
MPLTVPQPAGGLGNWLFQFAAAMSWGDNFVLCPALNYTATHSSNDYYSTLFRKFKKIDGIPRLTDLYEPEGNPVLNIGQIKEILKARDTRLVGYFQDWRYIPDVFSAMLEFPNPAILVKYPCIPSSCFIHVRGGDYVHSPQMRPVHFIDLTSYYTECIRHMKEKGITYFSVFTNDLDFCKTQPWLSEIDYEIIQENELDSLYLMTKCSAAICANSTFSWWGAFLNRNRPICMPSKWFNTSFRTEGYYFPQVEVVTV